MEKFMPGYIDKVWTRFYGANVAPKFVEAPHAWSTPQHGLIQPQLTTTIEYSPLLSAPDKTRLQDIVGSLLYFARCIDSTILATLGSTGPTISDRKERVAAMAAYLLNFCANNHNPKVRYYDSDMQLCGHTDASYLSVSKARSCAAAYFYLSTDNGALLPPDHKSKLTARPNGAIHVMSTVIRQVLSSTTEAEVGATFYGCQDAVPLRNTLNKIGHVQEATLIITDNESCEVILNNTFEQRRLKAMDMRFYWIKCRIAQVKFKLLWRSGQENLADYFTKLHAKVHHKITRPLYVINSLASRGCNKGVFIGTNITYVPFVPTTSNRNRHKHIGTRTLIARPSARTRL